MSNVTAAKKQDKPEITQAEKNKKIEQKATKFREMAGKRTAKAMQAIRLLGNLASPNYVYSTEQVDKVISALQKEIDTVYEAFKAKKGKEKVTFQL